jgi:hypothetical protein
MMGMSTPQMSPSRDAASTPQGTNVCQAFAQLKSVQQMSARHRQELSALQRLAGDAC